MTSRKLNRYLCLLSAAFDGNVAGVNYFIQSGEVCRWQEHEEDAYKLVPLALFLAIEQHHIDVVKLLVEHGVDIVNTQDHRHRTPLHRAALLDSTVLVKLLLDNGPHIDTLDINHQTPWAAQIACCGKDRPLNIQGQPQ